MEVVGIVGAASEEAFTEVVVEEGAELVTGLLDILNSLYLLLSLVKKRHALL